MDRNCLYLGELLWDCCKETKVNVEGQGQIEGQGDSEEQGKPKKSVK